MPRISQIMLSTVYPLSILIYLPLQIFAQQQTIPLNREYQLWLERNLNDKNSFSHTSFKPYLESAINYDSLIKADSAHHKTRNYASWVSRKLKSESLILVDSGLFHLAIDPLFHFQYSNDQNDKSQRADTVPFINNTRGLLLRADIGKKISLMSSFLENQSYLPGYIDDFVKTHRVVPGSGRVKPFKNAGYDYAMASGYVSYSPWANVNFQFGHDKNFIGDGYRSLLLSDNSFNYPYFKITSSFWKNRLQYTNLYTRLSSLSRIPAATTPEALFMPKSGSFHYLSFIPWKHLHIGFFEGIIWQRWDSSGTKTFNWNFINPVLFSNTAMHGLNDNNNSLIGVNLKLKILKGLSLYGQLAYDNHNEFGYQAGLKSFDLFTIKNLNIQIEYNEVAKSTYTHRNFLQAYSHYNQALAHPLGQGFKEIVSIVDYRWGDFFLSANFNFSARQGDITKSDPENVSGQMVNYPDSMITIFIHDYRMGYIINHQTNMNLFAGIFSRVSLSGNIDYPYTRLIYFGIRTSLFNQYLDF